jgi:hypothetical protein
MNNGAASQEEREKGASQAILIFRVAAEVSAIVAAKRVSATV